VVAQYHTQVKLNILLFTGEYLRVKQTVFFGLVTVLKSETCTCISVVVGFCKVVVVGGSFKVVVEVAVVVGLVIIAVDIVDVTSVVVVVVVVVVAVGAVFSVIEVDVS
jgi:hypothetical protein